MDGVDVLRFFKASCRRDGLQRAVSISTDSETPWRSVQTAQQRYLTEYLIPRALQMKPADWERTQPSREMPARQFSQRQRQSVDNRHPARTPVAPVNQAIHQRCFGETL